MIRRSFVELLGRMTLEEKIAQLVGVWVSLDAGAGQVTPYQGMFVGQAHDLDRALSVGVGQLTRPFGSAPVGAAEGARIVTEFQGLLARDTRLGIPAVVHEECLAGFMTLGATAFPCPLNLASAWDPDLVREVAAAIGRQMRSVGVHQGLAPVLDVVRDHRWGRTEETFGEDPYLVGSIGTAYVQGLQSSGVAATVKHFAGYSASEGGRNLAPSHVGPRELEDVFLVPFEMAVRDGGAMAVMNAYQDIDGEPAAASHSLLTGVLRDRWGFEGVVVSDYFSVTFLQTMHGVSGDKAHSAALAIHAGIDVELPNPDCFAEPLLEAVERGLVSEAEVDRAVERVLRFKDLLGLSGEYAVPRMPVDLDSDADRALARRVAERSIVLLRNEGGLLPLAPGTRVAVVGPSAEEGLALLGNYSFEHHVADHLDEPPGGVHVVSIAEGLRAELGQESVTGSLDVADVAVVVVADKAGHFGRGTVGEGSDVDDLTLPLGQQAVVEDVVASGTPTVVVLITGRPYDLTWVAEHVPAVVAAWFPGEEGGAAVAGVLSGRVNPSGRTPLTWGAGAGQQPLTYFHKPLARSSYAGSSTRPLFPFGHGLSYTTFSYRDLALPAELAVDGELEVACTVANVGERDGDEVVQLFTRDPVASVTRPVLELKAFQRVSLDAGKSARVIFSVPTDMLSFTGIAGRRVVEPGVIEVTVGPLRGEVVLTGDVRVIDGDRCRFSGARIAR
jgi:beta-glucosidase-like glycosyl hydrolase